MTEKETENKVKEDVKEYLGAQGIKEAIMALEALPSEHRHFFVDELINASMNSGSKVVVLVVLVEKLFSAARSHVVKAKNGFYNVIFISCCGNWISGDLRRIEETDPFRDPQ
ncbi:unnamed protein product [Rhizoctonia solani]|uniref:MI domain-containing protein n=1 Tax=Rhizoctonia solani TaxID=456999 RepID=A0A8H3D325_9AGAM|nr:unnamed protein product [Rhizoctonia solani]